MEHILHPFGPVFDEHSRVLVLGTLPSPKSREQGFYYGHPRNRFWPVLAEVFGEETPKTPAERRAFALRHRIALWDVLSECDIEGAADSSIKNPVPSDVPALLKKAPVAAVFTTGATATRLYKKFIEPKTGLAPIPLPSTSPANARLGLSALASEYRKILEYTE